MYRVTKLCDYLHASAQLTRPFLSWYSSAFSANIARESSRGYLGFHVCFTAPVLVQKGQTTVEDTYGTNNTYTKKSPSFKNFKLCNFVNKHQSSAQWTIVVFSPSSDVIEEFLPHYLIHERGEQIV
jgi:hypothetical protein